MPKHTRFDEGGADAVADVSAAAPSFAYVTMVMGDETYVQGALVLAQSLRDANTAADLVVMVSEEVGEEARMVLARVFTTVEQVGDLTVQEVRQRKQPRFDEHYLRHGANSWLCRIFTKFNLFGLKGYTKVCWLDADMLAVSCPDSLFALRPPAGVCSYYALDAQSEKHGKPVPRADVEKALTMSIKSFAGRKGFDQPYGIRGCVLVLTPSVETLEQVRADLEQGTAYGETELVVGPDELYISRKYVDSWTHVHHKAWKRDVCERETGEEAVLLHFVTNKPWGGGGRDWRDWPNFDGWWEVAKRVTDRVPASAAFFSDRSKLVARGKRHRNNRR